MDLVRDLLDKQVVDRNGQELGRVDSIILDVAADGSATVSAIEIGLISFAQRLHPLLGRYARAIEIILGVRQSTGAHSLFEDHALRQGREGGSCRDGYSGD